MPGLEINMPAADRFTRLLGAYLEANTRNAGELVAKKARDVSFQLYKVTRAAAPSKNDIRRAVHQQGWNVKRPSAAQKRWMRKPGDPIAPGKKGANRQALNRLKGAVMGKRMKARGYAATGWLPAVRKLGGKEGAKGEFISVPNPKGTVTIEGMGTGSPKITIANQTPGIATMERKHHLVQSAFNAASGDVVTYLRKKQSELAQQIRTS